MNNGVLSNTSNTRKYYPGIDLLKFIMSLVVVAIHVKPFETSSVLFRLFSPLFQSAVPVFFLCSSFLLFNKIASNSNRVVGESGGKLRVVFHFISRIGLLYLVWFVIDLPFIIANKGYFKEFGILESIGVFIKDLFLGTTFPGSWFLSALVVSVIIVFGFSRWIGDALTFVLALLVYVYVTGQDFIPENWQGLYNWYSQNVRKEVYNSFPFALVWVAMGACSSSNWYKRIVNSISRNTTLLWLCFGITYLLMVAYPKFASLLVLLLVPTLFEIGKTIRLESSNKWKFLREASILIFLFHFSIAGKKDLFLDFVGNYSLVYHLVFYIIVVMISFMFASCILLLEKNKFFRLLKYLH